MAYARFIDGDWVETIGFFTVGTDDDAIQYPAGWLDGADDEQRAALGAVAITEEAAPASSLQMLGQALVDVDGAPHRRWAQPPIADVRASRLAELAALRWSAQQATTWNSRSVASDDTTAARITSAVLRAHGRRDGGGRDDCGRVDRLGTVPGFLVTYAVGGGVEGASGRR